MKLYRGYKKEHFENVKNNLINEYSSEDISSFDDIVYKSNAWYFGKDCDSYDFNPEILQNYINNIMQLAYDVEGVKLIARGVNCCTVIENVTQFYASPDADIIVEFEGTILSDNLGGDGYIAKIEKILNIIEF